jgi:hypothetical protein
MAEKLVTNIISKDAFDEVKNLSKEMDILVQKLEQAITNAKNFDAAFKSAKGVIEFEKALYNTVDAQNALIKTGEQLKDNYVKQEAAQKVVIDQTKALTNAIKDSAGIVDILDSKIDINSKKLAENKVALSENKKEQADLKKLYNEQKISLDSYTDKLGVLIKAEANLKVITSELDKEQKQFAKSINTAEDSIDRGANTLGRFKDEFRKLSDADKNSEFGKELLKNIDALDPAVKKANEQIGNFQMSVGNYAKASVSVDRSNFSGSIQILGKAFDEVKGKLDSLKNKQNEFNNIQKQTADGLKQTADGLKQTADGLKQNTVVIKEDLAVVQQLEKEYQLLDKVLNSAEAGFLSMKQEIKNNEVAIEQLSQVYGENSSVVESLIKENGKLRDSQADLIAKQKAIGSDTFVFDGLLQAGQALVGIYGAAQGAAALFGEEDENLQKQMVKLQAAMALVQGVQAAVNALQKEGAAVQLYYSIQTKVTAGAQAILTFAMAGTTVAAKALRIALLATGIGAIVVLLGYFISATNSSTNSIKEQKEEQDKLNEALDQYRKNLDDIINQNEKIRNAREGGLNQLKREADLLKAQGKDAQASAKEALVASEELYNLKVRAATFSAKDYATQKEAQLAQIDLSEQIKNKENEINVQKAEGAKKLADQGRENAKKAAEEAKKSSKAAFDELKAEAEERIKIFKTIADNENNNYYLRLVGLGNYQKEQKELIETEQKYLLNVPKITAGEIEKINGDSKRKLNELEFDAGQQRIAIIKKNAEEEKAVTEQLRNEIDRTDNKDAQKDTITKNTNEPYLKFAETNALEYKIDIENLNKSLQQKKISIKEYNEEKAKIDEKYEERSLSNQIENNKALIDNLKGKGIDVTDLLKQQAELEMMFSDLTTKHFIENEEKKEAKRKEIRDKSIELFNEVSKLFETAVLAGYDREKNEIQDQINAREEQKTKEIEAVNAEGISAQEKANKIVVINTRAQAQKEQLERRQRQIDLERARFERAFNIGQIIAKTAIAVIAQSEKLPFSAPLVALVASIGAIQLAAALAQPLPKFAKGTKDSGKAQFSIVGEEGTELLEMTDGKKFLTPNEPTITFLPAHTKVIPNNELMLQQARETALYNSLKPIEYNVNNTQQQIQIEKLENLMQQTVSAIKSKPVAHITNTWKGVETSYKDVNGWTKYINTYINS